MSKEIKELTLEDYKTLYEVFYQAEKYIDFSEDPNFHEMKDKIRYNLEILKSGNKL